jgi:hypothetical protein
VELPEDVPQNIIEHLRTTFVAGKPMKISRSRGGQAFATGQSDPGPGQARPSRPPRPKKAKSGIGKKTKKPKKPKKAP